MKTRLIFAFFLFSFLIGMLFPVQAGAQDNCLIEGDIIQITTKFPQINEKGFFNDKFDGTFVRFQNDLLFYENGKAMRFVPVSEIKCLEVKIGEKKIHNNTPERRDCHWWTSLRLWLCDNNLQLQ